MYTTLTKVTNQQAIIGHAARRSEDEQPPLHTRASCPAQLNSHVVYLSGILIDDVLLGNQAHELQVG